MYKRKAHAAPHEASDGASARRRSEGLLLSPWVFLAHIETIRCAVHRSHLG